MAYYKTPQGAYLKLDGKKITSPVAAELKQLRAGQLTYETKSYGDVYKLTQAPIVAPTVKQPTTTKYSTREQVEAAAKAGTVTPAVTQPPITTTSAKPTIGISQIAAGKQAITSLTALGVSTDIHTIRKNWSKFGLDTKLGSWIGSTTQWNAYAKYSKDELERIETGIKEVQEKLTAVQKRAETEGITPTPATPTTPTTPTITTLEDGGAGTIGDGGTILEPNTLKTVQLSNVDIGDIITEIETGELATPETVIAGEVTQLLTDAEKARASQALSQFQQQMATAGQAFSSIRSTGEAAQAAESLSRLSGIRLDLAGKIIDAARQEQTRRINAVQAQQKAQTAALKSMGYVIDPITGTLQKTLAARGYELSVQRFLEPERFSSGGSYFEYDRTSGDVRTIYQAPEKERNLNLRFITDETGNVTKIVSDPQTGEELYRDPLGAIGKPSSIYSWMKMSGYDPSDPEDVVRFEEDWGFTVTDEESEEDRDLWDMLKFWEWDVFRQ